VRTVKANNSDALHMVAYRRRVAWEIVRAPSVRVELFGGPTSRRLYENFTARHPRLRVVQRKRWGVAMLALPDSVEEYLGGRSRELVRQKRRRALARGFSFRRFDASQHVAEVLEINRSASARQGQPMPHSYLDESSVRRFCGSAGTMFGVFDVAGRVRAYTYAPVVGEPGVFVRLLGHAADLEAGTMYLLISEVIAAYIAEKREHGTPRWAMYDTFWGGREGMTYFKKRLGFRPYRIDWVWTERA
jgi:hypothetical protein